MPFIVVLFQTSHYSFLSSIFLTLFILDVVYLSTGVDLIDLLLLSKIAGSVTNLETIIVIIIVSVAGAVVVE